MVYFTSFWILYKWNNMAYYFVCMASFSQPCVWVLSVLFAAVIHSVVSYSNINIYHNISFYFGWKFEHFFPVLAIRKKAVVTTCSPVFEWTYVFTSLGWMLWTRMVPHIVGVPRTFRQSVKLFTKATVPCVVSSALYESSSSSTCQQHNIVLNGFNLHFPSN